MSGVPHSKRILKSTVAAAAAGAVVFAPLAPLAQEAGRSRDPLSISVGVSSAFTRVEFGGIIGVRSQVRREADKVIVRMGVSAAPDVSRLRVDPPEGVKAVETRMARGGATDLIITLAEGADARSGVADSAVWLNLYAPGKAPEPTQEDRAAATNSVVPVRAVSTPEKTVLTFQWGAPVGAAVFRRGEAVWVVFDTAAKMDLTGAKALGPAKDARWGAGPDYTAVRIAAPDGLPVAALGQGGTWTVTIGGPPAGATGVEVDRSDDGSATLVARMAGATKTVWLTDPLVGDRFAAVTALAPGKGFSGTRSTVDLTLIPTAQGLAVETPTDDLKIDAAGDLVTLSRPDGLTLSPPSATLDAGDHENDAPKRAAHPGLILEDWATLGEAGFSDRYRRLQDAAGLETIAAADNPRAPIEARLALARFLVGSGLNYEAIGVLNALVAKAPNMQGEPEVRGLRGAARVGVGRLEEAQADFAGSALSNDPASKVWQGYIAAEQGDWEGARRAFAAGASVIDDFPKEWRARFGAAHAMAAIELNDLPAARQLLDYVFSQNASAVDQLTARLVQARMFDLTGDKERALKVYKAVARAPLDGIATPAKLGAISLELDKGVLTPDQAAGQLELLKWRWRGDATELAVIRKLSSLYLQQGRYREALDALRSAGKRMAGVPGAAEIQADQSNAFRALFLEGAADGLQPVQALALFYDFRELTPIGADGDEMVRRLSRRLIDVDLLDQAAELLKHQVDERLDGVAKAQVATNLATVYLMDRQPEKALQAIWGSRTTLLPNAMNSERRALEARALMDLGRYDHALEVLDRDASAPAREVRADIFWKQQKWAEAAPIYEARLGDRYKTTGAPLTPSEESWLIRAGVGYSLAGNRAGLDRLHGQYSPFIAKARSANAIRVALDDSLSGVAGVGDYANLSANADTFVGWVNAAKQDFRNETGGSRPATPAR
ncbi:tetratricopeptide repeat protein [Brevundimonas sp.]|jgi:tetratricopeptide (TPR) repeat protein|uniref:tetratricopeptide repeat protein n=1 Tax=Brevundimonas sp. TaxID=1871086 RepID=UPI0037C09839